jgi:hypothetical protein
MFKITDDLKFSSSRNKSKNIEYITTVDIKKAGSKEIIDKSSDLETYLINKRFKLQK